jgi:ankyrin repeat protein
VATARGDLSVIKLLVSAGADVNALTIFTGKTALQLAVEFNHEEIVNYLLDCGASSTMLDSELGRLARLARKCGHTKVLRLLSQRSLAQVESMKEASRHYSHEELDDLEGPCAKLRDLSFHEDEVSDEEDELLQEHETDVILSSQSSPQLKDSDGSVGSDGDSWLCIELADCDAEIFRKV